MTPRPFAAYLSRRSTSKTCLLCSICKQDNLGRQRQIESNSSANGTKIHNGDKYKQLNDAGLNSQTCPLTVTKLKNYNYYENCLFLPNLKQLKNIDTMQTHSYSSAIQCKYIPIVRLQQKRCNIIQESIMKNIQGSDY